MANLEKIKKGFYTDGEKLYSYNMGVCVWCEVRPESENWLRSGNEEARVNFDKVGEITVKPVKAGMTFCNGEITVIDKERVEIIVAERINAKYDEKGYCVSLDGYNMVKRIIKR